MTINKTILDNFYTKLSYKHSLGFYNRENSDNSTYNGIIFSQLSDLFGLDAVYFIKDKPIIGFAHFDSLDEQAINELHLNLWNNSSFPILIIILPNQVRCYSNYIPPTIKNKNISSKNALFFTQKLAEDLSLISRQSIDSGLVWKELPSFFLQDNRVTYKLIEDLKSTCMSIASNSSEKEQAQNLIMKAILFLIFYEKGIITDDTLQQSGINDVNFANIFTSSRQVNLVFRLTSVIIGSRIISSQKKGSTKPEKIHLQDLQSVIMNRYSPDKECFGLYNYKYITAETLCSVFEELLYLYQKGVNIASHTPSPLVKIMLDEIIPNDSKPIKEEIKLMDPACGSGIFLQEAYRRLICKWILTNSKKPSMKDCYKILKDSIYGVDLKDEAIVATMTSLFLTFLEFYDEKLPEYSFKFPTLYNNNIVADDFFNENLSLPKHKFDFVIGNPPWQSNYDLLVKHFLAEYEHVVGDKQISQVFLWKSSQFIKQEGKICLLMPSKGLLYNFNPKNIEFRESFLKSYKIEKIINLSLFSNLLFDNSKFPASVIVYSLLDNTDKQNLTVYYTPRPSNKCWELSTIIEDSVDIKKIPTQHTIKNHFIWKSAYVGSSKDLLLISHLDKNFAKIVDICEDRNWIYGEGFQLGGGDKNVNKKMSKLPYIPAKSIYPFYVPQDTLKPLGETVFHRQREFELYQAPHTIVRGGQIFAAYIPYDAVFTHAVVCFSSQNQQDADLLKLLAAYLNSSLALYYLFLTSSTWCIERTDIHFAEYKTLPFAIPDNKTFFKQILSLSDELSKIVAENLDTYHTLENYIQLKDRLDNSIFEIFNLNNDQKQLILDTCSLTIPYYQEFSKSTRSKYLGEGIESPDSQYILNYAQTFCSIFNSKLSKYNHHLKASVYYSETSLNTIALTITPGAPSSKDITFIKNDKTYDELIQKLDKKAMNETGTSIYLTKYLRIYDGNTFYIVKPAEKRYWCTSCAFADAEKNLKETLKLFVK